MTTKVDFDRPDVFAYLDYRQYLRDYYELRKATAGLSFRSFARKARLAAPNYLKLVIDGHRNLTDSTAQRFASACGLRGTAAEFFGALVRFGQAKSREEREAHYKGLKRFRRHREVHQLGSAVDLYHSHWYLPAVRELVTVSGFREDPKWIAEQLLPPISASQAEAAIQTLLELGLLLRGSDGQLKQADPVVSTGSGPVKSLHLRAYHRTMLQQAASSMDRLPAAQRDLSSVTLRLGPTGMQLVKARLAQLRGELIALAESEREPCQIIHVGLQAFPLSRETETGAG